MFLFKSERPLLVCYDPLSIRLLLRYKPPCLSYNIGQDISAKRILIDTLTRLPATIRGKPLRTS